MQHSMTDMQSLWSSIIAKFGGSVICIWTMIYLQMILQCFHVLFIGRVNIIYHHMRDEMTSIHVRNPNALSYDIHVMTFLIPPHVLVTSNFPFGPNHEIGGDYVEK